MSDDAVRRQYEVFPYPARDPRDETKRLVEGSPSSLNEIVHYLFAGSIEHLRPFRVLVAGGGTGDGLIMLAQECRDADIPVEIHYLDVSAAARDVAEARARTRGLDSITFHTGSLLAVGDVAPGPYHYIDCVGVLHHLADPPAGLKALVAQLSPEGGMGLMVYGTHGRTGVYPMQSALRTLTADLPPPEKVGMAKRLIRGLPPTNWFARNPLLADHRRSDAGLYDLLLHDQDRAFTVPELLGLLSDAGLEVASFIEPVRYRAETYVNDPKLRGRIEALDWKANAELAESLAGNMKTHVVYAVPMGRRGTSVAQPDNATLKPVLHRMDGEAFARTFRPGRVIDAEYDGIKVSLALPPLTGALLPRVDGHTSLTDLHGQLSRTRREGLPWDTFRRQFQQIYSLLNGINRMLLCR